MTRTDRLMTLEEVSERLAMSVRTLRRKIENGDLVACQFGRAWRITQPDLEDFIRRNRRQ